MANTTAGKAFGGPVSDAAPILWMVGLFIAFTVVCVVGANSCKASKCEKVGEETRRAVRYDMVNGCRIADKGRFVPLDRWRVLDE